MIGFIAIEKLKPDLLATCSIEKAGLQPCTVPANSLPNGRHNPPNRRNPQQTCRLPAV
jgi:hypothetical protein